MMSHDRKGSKRVLVIVNPTAGCRHRRRLEAILSALRDRGCEISVQATSSRGDAEGLAGQIDRRHIDVLAIAGGDGTINEVLNGIQDNAAPPLAIIPLGTANVLAIEIGLGTTVAAIADTIASGRPKRINLGLANGRRFAVMASVGFDAEVVRHISLDLKRYLGKGAYALETLHRLLAFDPPAYEFSIDGQTHRAHGIIVANGKHFAGRFVVAPDARLDKPSFDICCSTRSGRTAALHYLVSMVRGRLPERNDYEIIPASTLRIDGPKGAPLQADGDIIAHLPATIGIQPDSARLMIPQDPA